MTQRTSKLEVGKCYKNHWHGAMKFGWGLSNSFWSPTTLYSFAETLLQSPGYTQAHEHALRLYYYDKFCNNE